jgi:hypothetical protein
MSIRGASASIAIEKLAQIWSSFSYATITDIQYNNVQSIVDIERRTTLRLDDMNDRDISGWICKNRLRIKEGKITVSCGYFSGRCTIGKRDNVSFHSNYHRQLDFNAEMPTFDFSQEFSGWNAKFHIGLPLVDNKLFGTTEMAVNKKTGEEYVRFTNFFKPSRQFQFIWCLVVKGPDHPYTKNVGMTFLQKPSFYKGESTNFVHDGPLTRKEITQIRDCFPVESKGAQALRSIVDLYLGISISELKHCSDSLRRAFWALAEENPQIQEEVWIPIQKSPEEELLEILNADADPEIPPGNIA